MELGYTLFKDEKNGGLLKVGELKWCYEQLSFCPGTNKCDSDCKNKLGRLATGTCNFILLCVCSYRC
ncbi:hypothetical protein AHAS_Ahas03G0169800 [Arachis hypogaea]